VVGGASETPLKVHADVKQVLLVFIPSLAVNYCPHAEGASAIDHSRERPLVQAISGYRRNE
jgi:hypothetical protein